MFPWLPAKVIARCLLGDNAVATGRITKTAVDALASGASDVLLWDDKLRGFGLKVTPTGSRTYLYQYRIGGRGGKTRRYTIGKHGTLTAENARKEAERLAILVSQGTDPQEAKQDQARKSIDLAFKPYAERFVEDCLKAKWKAWHVDAEALLRLYAVPILGSKPLHEITRADVRAVLNPVRKKVATCRNLFTVLRRLFRWAVSEGDLTDSPISGMEPPPAPAARDRVLTDAELALIWNGADALGYPFGPMVRLLVITGQRLEEVAGLEWSEVDQASTMWTIPAKRAKNGELSHVPLASLAVAEFAALAKRKSKADSWPKRGHVFTTTGETSVSGFSKAKKRVDREAGKLAAKIDEPVEIAPWRFHDLRRTVATGLQRLGVRFEVTEAILNHVGGSRSGIAGIYQRHDWADEKRAALNAWSDHVQRVLNGKDETNVVPIAAARG